MSAPALALFAAPSVGHAAAPKRGEATPDADFAAILDEAAPADAPTKTAAPTSTPSVAEIEPAPVEASTDEASVEMPAVFTGAAETPVAAPVPLTSPLPAVAIEPALPAAPPAETPIVGAVPAPEPEADPAPASATDRSQTRPVPMNGASDAAPPLTDETAPAETASPSPAEPPSRPPATPQPASPVLAPAAAALALPPRPARTTAEAVTAAEPATGDDPQAAAGSPGLSTHQAEAPALRTPLDRTPDRGQNPAPVNREEARGAATPSDDPAARDAPAPNLASKSSAASLPAPAAAPAVLSVPVEIDAVVPSPLSAATSTTEAPSVDIAASPALPSASRASIETTVQIAAQIVRRLEGRSTRFEMALTPEGLGQVDVSLNIDADGKLAARLAFDNPLAATELRGRVDELRRQLQEAGFTVADDALSFTQRDPSTSQGGAFDRRPDPRNARAFGAASRLEADADRLAAPPRWIPLTLTPDRVDMKV